MRKTLIARVGVGLAVAVAVVLAVVLLDRRTAGDAVTGDIEGIQVSVATPGSTGAGGPGPGNGDAEAPTVTPSQTPVAVARGIHLPDVLLAFTATLAQVEGGDVTFAYRAAVQARDAGQYGLAAVLFETAASAGDELEPFARLRAAQMAAREHGAASAAGAFADLVAPGGAAERLPTSAHLVALFEAADALEEADQPWEALAALERVPSVTGNTFQLAQSYAERARILQDLGEPSWVGLAVRTMETQPGASAAAEALDRLEAAGEGYPQLVAAYVEYRARRNDAADARYRALLDGGSLDAVEAGQAWFYLGALQERFYYREGALDAYARSLLVAPDGPLADDSRYWRGRVMEEMGRTHDAAREYDLLAEVYPGSGFAEESRLRAAIALGLGGDGAGATSRLASIATSSSPETAAEAARWHHVLVSRFGAPSAGDLSAHALDPTSYVSAFERAGDAAIGALPLASLAERPVPIEVDREAIDGWLAARVGPRPVAASVLEAPDVRLAWRLASAGEGAVARGLLVDVIVTRREQPYDLVDLAVAAQRRGLHDVALSAATSVLRGLGPQEYLLAPRSLLGLAYPVAYLREATEASEEFGVPVLLLMALVRQESAFNPDAGSSAGAFGLTQVIYPTGEAIARDLSMSSWTFADLARPSVSMRFGAYYLAVQLSQFEGHYLAALSAYNGGPGNASRWLNAQPFGGPDGYVYAVDFTETRAYLEHVTANYAMYRYLYAGAEAPSLPHGG